MLRRLGPLEKLALPERTNSQRLVFRMERQPFSTSSSALSFRGERQSQEAIVPGAAVRRAVITSAEARGICFSGRCLTRPCLNPCRISTCAKRTRNSRRISTSIFKDLKLLKINTYTKIIARVGVLFPPLEDPDIRSEPIRMYPRVRSSPEMVSSRVPLFGTRDLLSGPFWAFSLESALAKNSAVTHVQSALPKQRSLTLLK